MMFLDINVLVRNVFMRYIAQDDAKRLPQATNLIASLTTDAPGYISLVSVVELV